MSPFVLFIPVAVWLIFICFSFFVKEPEPTKVVIDYERQRCVKEAMEELDDMDREWGFLPAKPVPPPEPVAKAFQPLAATSASASFFTVQQIRDMSLQEYMHHRDMLLPLAKMADQKRAVDAAFQAQKEAVDRALHNIPREDMIRSRVG